MLTELAPAKVNLCLHIVDKRDDGYHMLESLVTFAGVGDVLHAKPSNHITLEVNGPFAKDILDENIVLEAARALQALTGVRDGAHIVLEKKLPVSAGIGGGSSDAAAAIRLLARLWGVSPEERQLKELALALGADVPVCLLGSSAWVTGIGDEMEPVEIPRLPMVLVNPLIPMSTRKMFEQVRPPYSENIASPGQLQIPREVAAWLAPTRNDFEAIAGRMAPQINTVFAALAAQPGCLLARMSGSGATCFGLFSTPGQAKEAVEKLHDAHPRWWVAA